MVNQRHDLKLLRMMRYYEEDREPIPISYIHHFPGWFKFFDINLSPFHCYRAVLYHKQNTTDLAWMIGFEAGLQQRLFLSVCEAEFFRENLLPDGPDFMYGSVLTNHY